MSNPQSLLILVAGAALIAGALLGGQITGLVQGFVNGLARLVLLVFIAAVVWFAWREHQEGRLYMPGSGPTPTHGSPSPTPPPSQPAPGAWWQDENAQP